MKGNLISLLRDRKGTAHEKNTSIPGWLIYQISKEKNEVTFLHVKIKFHHTFFFSQWLVFEYQCSKPWTSLVWICTISDSSQLQQWCHWKGEGTQCPMSDSIMAT